MFTRNTSAHNMFFFLETHLHSICFSRNTSAHNCYHTYANLSVFYNICMRYPQCQTFLHLMCSTIRYLRIMRFSLNTSEVLCVCMFYAILYKANCTFCYNTEFSQRTAIVCIAKPKQSEHCVTGAEGGLIGNCFQVI